MRICRRRLAPREIDHELVWLLVSLGAGGGLMVWFWAHLPMPGCAFHSLTGLPCLTCGATRSALQFMHGHFITSLAFNPLAFASYCGIALFDLYAAAVLVLHAPRLRFEKFSNHEKKMLRGFVVALLVANWIYLLSAKIV
jgi:hypothetical protein